MCVDRIVHVEQGLGDAVFQIQIKGCPTAGQNQPGGPVRSGGHAKLPLFLGLELV